MGNLQTNTGDGRADADFAATDRNYLTLGLACLAVALAVVVVWMLIQRDDQSDQPVVAPEGPAAKVPDQEVIVPKPSITLATAPAEVSNEDLQTELLGELESLESRFPETPQALHVAAGAYDKIHQTIKATELWEKCIRLDSRHTGPLLGLARLLSEKGEDVQAVELLEQALDDGVRSAELYYRLASAHSKVGEVERAEEVMKIGVAAVPQVAINWLLLGQLQTQLRKFEEAETSLLKSLELDESSNQVYFALANALQRQGKSEEAAKYRKLFAERKAAQTQENRDRPFQETYQQALRPVVVGTLTAGAAVFAAHGHAKEAERILLRANALEPENTQVLDELARLYRGQRKLADAWVVQQRLIDLQPDNAVYHMNLANLAAQLRDWEAAESALLRARDLWPDNPLPYFGSAQVQLQLGNLDLARQHAENSVQRGATAESYALLAIICEQLGDASAAQAARQKAERMSSGGR